MDGMYYLDDGDHMVNHSLTTTLPNLEKDLEN